MSKRPSHLKSFLFSLLFSVILVAALILGTDQLCRNDIQKRLPYYPNASLVSQNKELLRYRAAGRTDMVFKTDDPPETVSAWFRELNLAQLDEGIFRGLADITRRYEPDTDGGTLIYYTSVCATQ